MNFLKNIILKIDNLIFQDKLTLFYSEKIHEKRLRRYMTSKYSYGFNCEYGKNRNSLLNKLSDKYGSDKGEVNSENNPYSWPSHTYADFYELLFQLRRKDVKTLIECGLGTNNPELASTMGINAKPGGSLKLWCDYFPNANIIGIDIDKDILFNEERIDTYQCDQTSKSSIQNFVNQSGIKEGTIDIIIDDGLHEFHAGVSLFEGLKQYLSEDGFYIIEDIRRRNYIPFKKYFAKIKHKYTARFVNLERPNLQVHDNRLIIITPSSQ